jgi:hypothetical protein
VEFGNRAQRAFDNLLTDLQRRIHFGLHRPRGIARHDCAFDSEAGDQDDRCPVSSPVPDRMGAYHENGGNSYTKKRDDFLKMAGIIPQAFPANLSSQRPEWIYEVR